MEENPGLTHEFFQASELQDADTDTSMAEPELAALPSSDHAAQDTTEMEVPLDPATLRDSSTKDPGRCSVNQVETGAHSVDSVGRHLLQGQQLLFPLSPVQEYRSPSPPRLFGNDSKSSPASYGQSAGRIGSIHRTRNYSPGAKGTSIPSSGTNGGLEGRDRGSGREAHPDQTPENPVQLEGALETLPGPGPSLRGLLEPTSSPEQAKQPSKDASSSAMAPPEEAMQLARDVPNLETVPSSAEPGNLQLQGESVHPSNVVTDPGTHLSLSTLPATANGSVPRAQERRGQPEGSTLAVSGPSLRASEDPGERGPASVGEAAPAVAGAEIERFQELDKTPTDSLELEPCSTVPGTSAMESEGKAIPANETLETLQAM